MKWLALSKPSGDDAAAYNARTGLRRLLYAVAASFGADVLRQDDDAYVLLAPGVKEADWLEEAFLPFANARVSRLPVSEWVEVVVVVLSHPKPGAC